MFIVIEIQKMANNQIAYLVHDYATLKEAESAYHSILASAAVSTLPLHSAAILGENGVTLKHESYTHEIEGVEE